MTQFNFVERKEEHSWVFISSYGLNENEHSLAIVDKSLTLDDLF